MFLQYKLSPISDYILSQSQKTWPSRISLYFVMTTHTNKLNFYHSSKVKKTVKLCIRLIRSIFLD